MKIKRKMREKLTLAHNKNEKLLLGLQTLYEYKKHKKQKEKIKFFITRDKHTKQNEKEKKNKKEIIIQKKLQFVDNDRKAQARKKERNKI